MEGRRFAPGELRQRDPATVAAFAARAIGGGAFAEQGTGEGDRRRETRALRAAVQDH
jgi:hypothetical protein